MARNQSPNTSENKEDSANPCFLGTKWENQETNIYAMRVRRLILCSDQEKKEKKVGCAGKDKSHF